MITAGIDVGTRFVKSCVTDGNRVLGTDCREVGRDIDGIIRESYRTARAKASVRRWQVKRVLATGDGYDLVKMADGDMTEAACVARAVHALDPEVRTVIDVGALFIRVMSINEKGGVVESVHNELCAAGSGKFLEVVAGSLEIPFWKISEHVRGAANPYKISSSCAVFAESEIISQVNAGINADDLLAGVVGSVASKVVTLMGKVTGEEEYALIGGVSRIPAFEDVLKQRTDRRFTRLPMDVQAVAAYGAALFAGLSADRVA